MIDSASDIVMFWVVQGAMILLAIFIAMRECIAKWIAGSGGAKLIVTRSETSMQKFYGLYAVVNGLLVALCLTVNVIESHRVFWVLVDTALAVYVCLLNPWFRNVLLVWAEKLTKIEQR
jgi:urea transporter